MAPADLDYVVVDVTGNMWAGPFASEFEAAEFLSIIGAGKELAIETWTSDQVAAWRLEVDGTPP